ncbi:adsorption protein A [Trinickia symbiotica]|uniref:Bacteriophage N4 adsorption protein A n=1 Tax=Trinickia symbiotica TaxID=863227 RepID=A0A2N7X2F6_9BURK|nr:tetratricopeptide repeat protein [Trinickia symbiotica]PMS35761.1 bacteriophage N4 adsorption protein A [Trinickia symbiotica]PPK44618.1 adsorption protein A [Trinickia symbiotica]
MIESILKRRAGLTRSIAANACRMLRASDPASPFRRNTPPSSMPSRTVTRAALAFALAAGLSCAGGAALAQPAAHAQAVGVERIPLPLEGAAYRVAQEAYAAYGRGDYKLAIARAREAIRQRPDVVSLRLLLANVLAAQRRYGEASRSLREAIAQLGPDRALVSRRRQIDALGASTRAVARAGHSKQAADPDRLTGAAYSAAQQAYKAYNAKDFASAVKSAQEAIGLRPDVLRLRLLLIDAAGAAGDDKLAWDADVDAVKRLGDNEDLRLRRLFVGSRLSLKASVDAYDARAKGDFAVAEQAARNAVDYAPDAIDYRIELFDVLAAQREWPALEAAASDAIAYDNTELMPYVFRAYARAAQQRFDAAEPDLDQVFHDSDATHASQNIARAIAADIWIEEGRPQRALEKLTALRPTGDDSDALIVERIDRARRRIGAAGRTSAGAAASAPAAASTASAASAAAGASSASRVASTSNASTTAPASPVDARTLAAQVAANARPSVECDVDEFGAGCDPSPADPGFAAARASERAAERGDKKGAVRFARDAVAAAPTSALHRMELVDALDDAGETKEAGAEARAMVRDGMLDALTPISAAYVALRAGDDKRAVRDFRRAATGGKLSADEFADAGYAGLAADRDADAARYFERAIDASSGAKTSSPAARQQVEDLRSAHAEATRKWGFEASLGYRSAGLQSGFTATPSPTITNNWQAGVEAYWRPFGSLGDRLFEVYARGDESFGVKGGDASGASTLEAAFGARAKPFADLDAIVAFERIVAIGSRAQGDWLARIGYSGGIGTERRIDVPSWWTVQGYAEAGHFVNAGSTYATASLEAGRTFRIDRVTPRWTVFPYAVIGADYDSSIDRSIPLGAGLGVSTRYVFRDSKYDAPRSYVDLSLQYRLRLAGDDRARGVFFETVFSY